MFVGKLLRQIDGIILIYTKIAENFDSNALASYRFSNVLLGTNPSVARLLLRSGTVTHCHTLIHVFRPQRSSSEIVIDRIPEEVKGIAECGHFLQCLRTCML